MGAGLSIDSGLPCDYECYPDSSDSEQEQQTAEMSRRQRLNMQTSGFAAKYRRRTQTPAAVRLKHSRSVLPLSIWGKLMVTLVDDCDLQGMRGPSVVARDIISASMVWPEAKEVAAEAWQALSERCLPHFAQGCNNPDLRRGCDWALLDKVLGL